MTDLSCEWILGVWGLQYKLHQFSSIFTGEAILKAFECHQLNVSNISVNHRFSLVFDIYEEPMCLYRTLLTSHTITECMYVCIKYFEEFFTFVIPEISTNLSIGEKLNPYLKICYNRCTTKLEILNNFSEFHQETEYYFFLKDVNKQIFYFNHRIKILSEGMMVR